MKVITWTKFDEIDVMDKIERDESSHMDKV
jgi:hypothetical protein